MAGFRMPDVMDSRGAWDAWCRLALEAILPIVQSTCSTGTCQYPNTPPTHDRSDIRPLGDMSASSMAPPATAQDRGAGPEGGYLCCVLLLHGRHGSHDPDRAA